jgi:signal transduction histidine kinase
MGGTMEVESKRGEGTTFVVYLPGGGAGETQWNQKVMRRNYG